MIACVAAGDQAEIDAAVHAARRAFETGPWSKMTPSERGRLIWKLGDLIEKHGDELAEIETLDNGKPLAVAKAGRRAAGRRYVPLHGRLGHQDHRRDVSHLRALHARRRVLQLHGAGTDRRRRADHPLELPPADGRLEACARRWPPAARVVLKPAEQTPLSALRLGELIEEAGFPQGVVNIVTGLGETAGAALAAHKDVDKVAFTGSTEVGRLIVAAAGRTNLKKVTLELGGKSPNIVFADADLSAAIPGAAGAIFFNHGQCCCAGSRLYVHKSVYDQVVEGIAHEARQIRLGSGFDPATQMGPLVSQEQLDRVCGYIDAGVQRRRSTGDRRQAARRPGLLRRADGVRRDAARR